MARPGRILVVEDVETWQRALRSTLQGGNFHVDVASSVEEALGFLESTYYHVMVLDIRMQESRTTNQEGMTILRKPELKPTLKTMKTIMLSAHADMDLMYESFREHGVIDFLQKDDFNNRTFLRRVETIFQDEVLINLGLEVHWQDIAGPQEAIAHLKIGGNRVRGNSELQNRVASELDDLLCRLFPQYESVLLRALSLGYSGTAVFWVQPYSDAGEEQPVVVKAGDRNLIDEEVSHYAKYVKHVIGGGRSTIPLNQRYTPLLGGVIYSLLGASDDPMQSFGEFYRNASSGELEQVLHNLVKGTCKTWYSRKGRLQARALGKHYREVLDFTPAKIEHALFELRKTIQGRDKLHFTSLSAERTFKNPLPMASSQDFTRSTYFSVTHGDFNQNNILVDSSKHAWLIDFQSTGPGHILRDIAQLDAEIRLTLLAAGEASLEDRLRLEESLMAAHRFSQVVHLMDNAPTGSADLLKAFRDVVYLRMIAQEIVVQNPSDDISEYYIALMYYALDTARFSSLPAIQREHAFLSACVIAGELGL